jgi:PAS domain S-box-containing protein
VLALYAWAFVAGIRASGSNLLISDTAAVFALLTIAASGASYFLATKTKKYTTETALGAYILLAVTVAMVILETGGAASPFIALWMFVSVFAGIFGARALIPLLVAVNLYLIVEFTRVSLSKEAIITIILGGELPLLLSFLLWHTKLQGENNKERAYYDLANELNQVSNKAEVVINAIGEGVIAIDTHGTIELINPAAQRIIGWGKQDAIGLDYKSVLHLVDKKDQELTRANDPIFDVLNTNESKSRNDLTLITSSEKKLNVSVVVSPLGRLGAGAIIVFHDITKEQAEEREQAEFVSTASHEMRTPVASIEGYLGLALNPATATIDEKAREFIGKAHESAQHLGRLFQDLLDVTKAEDGRLANNTSVVDVVAYTKDIIDGFKPKATEKGLRIFFKPETTSSSLTGGEHSLAPVFYAHLDRDHLREILSNLIENAIKYTLQGEVVVDINADEEHIVVSVVDSGIGIPPEDIPHLFQKFYRVDNSDTREIGGTGLGLYLCRRLAEAMNGRIWVESEYKKGSTFYLEVPRISHEEATKLIEQSQAAEQASGSAFTPPNRRFADATSTASTTTAAEGTLDITLPPVTLHGRDVGVVPPRPAAAAVATPAPVPTPAPATPAPPVAPAPVATAPIAPTPVPVTQPSVAPPAPAPLTVPPRPSPPAPVAQTAPVPTTPTTPPA